MALLAIFSILLSACSSLSSIIQAPTTIPMTLPTLSPSAVVKVQLGDVIQSIEYTGRVVSLVDQQIQFQTSGRVAKVYVEQGDPVSQGQLLAQLDSPVTEFDLRKAQIDLDKANLLYQQAQVDTPKTQPDYAMVVGLKKADVDYAQVELDALNAEIAATKLTAPMEGVISTLSIAENSTVDPTTVAMVLSDPTQLEISGIVSDPNAGKLVEKMPVMVSLLDNPATLVDGFIHQVTSTSGGAGVTPTGAATVLSTQVELNGDWPASGFNLGTQVTLQAVLESHTNVLWLPPSALRTAAARQFVLVQDGDMQTRVDVQVGLSTDSQVEITQGLKEGQVVILP
jgi:RND family efflux transporter MFP subunit